MPSENTTQPSYSKCMPKACYSRKCYSNGPGEYNKRCRPRPGHKVECGCTAAVDTAVPAAENSEAGSGDADVEEMSSLEWVIQLFGHN